MAIFKHGPHGFGEILFEEELDRLIDNHINMKRFNEGDLVVLIRNPSRVSVVTSSRSDGDMIVDHGNVVYQKDYEYYIKKEPEIKMENINLAGYECEYYEYSSKVIRVKFQEWFIDIPFYKDHQACLKANELIVGQFFSDKMDEKVDAIMREFTSNFKVTIGKIKKLVLPNTKDLLLSRIIEEFKINITEVAKVFNDTSIKAMLLSLFK